jgi:hypothetical protein
VKFPGAGAACAGPAKQAAVTTMHAAVLMIVERFIVC